MEARTRKNRGLLICIVGIVCNLLLAAGKIVAGILTGFVAVTADGFNNLSDCGSGVVALISFFIAEKPADRQHPFGHRRAEHIASMIAGFFVLLLAAELLRSSATTVVQGSSPALARSLPVYLVLSLSIVVKAGMFFLFSLGARKLDSDVLKATATDSLCDCLATLAAIAGTALAVFLPSADGWAGIAVSLFIVWQGICILREATSKLLGQAPDPALSEQIKQMILSAEEILGVHDLQIYSYGRGAVFATIHAEMDASLSMLAAHTVIDDLEMKVKRQTGVQLTVHLDPVDLTNREESALKIKVWEAIREVTEGLELHDFRLIPGSNKVEFDVGVPYSCKLTDAALREKLESIVTALGAYEPIIRLDRE